MVSWKEFKSTIRRTLEQIKENPVADAAVKSTLRSVPFFGDFLADVYGNALGNAEDKSEQIVKLLENLQKISDEKLDELLIHVQANQEILVKSKNSLLRLVKDTEQIVNKLDEIKKGQINLEAGNQKIQEILSEIFEEGGNNSKEIKTKLIHLENIIKDEFKKINPGLEKFDISVTSERLLFYMRLQKYLRLTNKTFKMHLLIRDKLYLSLWNRNLRRGEGSFGVDEILYQFHSQMNNDEKIIFDLLRNMTEDFNEFHIFIKTLLENNREFFKDLPQLKDLYEHLSVWQAKYELLMDDPDMCLVYVGATQGKPFPKGLDNLVDKTIQNLREEIKLNEPLISLGKVDKNLEKNNGN